MSTITLQNFRVGSDLTVKVRLKDGGVAIDWSTLSGIRAVLYSDAQSSIAGRCDVTVDGEDPTLLVCRYAATKMQYLGVNRIVVSAKYMGVTKTYDKPAFTFVRWSEDQAGEEITIEDPEVTVEIDVEDVSSSILQEAVDAAFSAADRANEAAEAAEHMVDIHTGPAGKSAYEVAVEEGYTGTEEEWLASLKGPVGETPDISIGTVTTVEPGTPAAASMSGTPEAPVLNLSIPKGLVGATPNITVGTVTTGQPGTPVVVTITGTPEAPVLNVTIPQGMQGNTGSSVDYPYELVNNLTTNDATKGLSAAQGVVLDGKVSQLEYKVSEVRTKVSGLEDGAYYTSGYSQYGIGEYTRPEENDFTFDSLILRGVKINDNDTSIEYRVYLYSGNSSSPYYAPSGIINEQTTHTLLKSGTIEKAENDYHDYEIEFTSPVTVPAGQQIIVYTLANNRTFIKGTNGTQPSQQGLTVNGQLYSVKTGAEVWTNNWYGGDYNYCANCLWAMTNPTFATKREVEEGFAEIDERISIIEEEIQEQDTTEVGEFYENAWVRYSDGLIAASSGGAKLYVIRPADIPAGATKITAFVSTEQSIFAAIAFYSGDTPTTAGYLQSVSVQGGDENTGATYEANIPSSWGCCIVLNMSQYLANPTITVNAVDVVTKKEVIGIVDGAKALYNPFFRKPFYHHLNQERGASRQSIPAQSLLDITYSRELGFEMIEANAQKCSDNVFVCKHGNVGKLGAGLSFASGSGLSADTLFSAVSSTQLRQNVTYDCNRAKFNNVHIPTLAEFASKCRQENVAIKIGNDTDALAVVRQYLTDDMIFMTAYSRPEGFRGIIEYVWNPAGETIEQAIEKCAKIGSPLQITIASGRIDSMTDAQIKTATEKAHLAGYGIGVVYTNTNKTLAVQALGIDSICSTYRQINPFSDGDTLNIVSLNDSRIGRGTGVVYDSTNDTLFVPNGSNINVATDSPFQFGKVCVSIRYKGTVTVNCGTNASDYNLQGMSSDEEKNITWATAISPDSADGYSYCFWLSAGADTTIYDLKIHFSEM